MAALGFLFLAVFLAPLVICIVLLVKRKSDLRRIQNLEHIVSKLDIQSTTHSDPLKQEREEVLTKKPTPSPETEIAAGTKHDKDTAIESDPIPVPPVKKPVPEPISVKSKSPKKWTPKTIPPSQPKLLPFLRSMSLWPPEELARKEAGLIQWWAPRIAALLFVLTVIFASVYIGKRTSPGIRFIGLLISDFVVMGVGFYYLKRLPRFGTALFATGLVMLYVTCIAGYAAPPVRVIQHPVLGIALQFLVIVAIFVSSLKLEQRGIALLALVLGYLSSIFSAHEGLKESALLSSLALYLVGLLFARRFQWAPLLSISVLGVYLPIPALTAFGLIGSRVLILPHELSALAFLLVSASLLPASKRFGKSHNALSTEDSKKLAAINTTLCLGFGYLYFRMFDGELVMFYGSMGIVFAVWAAIFAQESLRSFFFQLFFLKAVALAALWATNYFSGDIRWFALIIEALLVSWVASRSRAVWQEVACLLIWFVSFVLVQRSLAQSSLVIGSFDWFLFLSYPILACILFGFLLHSMPEKRLRKYIYAFFAVLVGFLGGDVFRMSSEFGYILPFETALYAGVLALLAFVPRLKALPIGVASSILLTLANIRFWSSPSDAITLAALVGLSAAFAYGISRHYQNEPKKRYHAIEFVFHFSWITTLYAYLYNDYQTHDWFPLIAPVLSLGILFAARRPFRSMADGHIIPIAYLIAYPNFDDSSYFSSLATIALLGVVLTFPQWSKSVARQFSLTRKMQAWRILSHLLVLIGASVISYQSFEWLGGILVHCLVAIGFFALWRQHRRGIALMASEVSLFLASIYIVQAVIPGSNSLFQNLPWGKEMLQGALILCLISLTIGYAAFKWPQRYLSNRAKTSIAYLNGFGSFAIMALALSYTDLSLDSYYTPLTALFCLGLVATGIALKCKPYRLVAIIGLLLPLVRLFVYDIKETLYRIIAFAALAVLSVLIGFLYHKFQTRIE